MKGAISQLPFNAQVLVVALVGLVVLVTIAATRCPTKAHANGPRHHVRDRRGG